MTNDVVAQFRAYLNDAISSGVSLAKIARDSGIKKSTIDSYRRGINPTLDKTHQILRAIGKTMVLGG